MSDLVEELVTLVDARHPGTDSVEDVLSALTGCLVAFAWKHGVPREAVTEAAHRAYGVIARPYDDLKKGAAS